VGVADPPPGGGEPPPRPETPWEHAPRARHEPPPPAGLSTRSKIVAGIFIGTLYAVGMILRGDLLPGLVGGVLAGVLCFLVLREIEAQRRRRRS
jgi:hypothetical protein